MIPLVFTSTALVLLDAFGQGKTVGRPIAGGVVTAFVLSLMPPDLARSLGWVILLTAMLTSGARVAARAGLAVPTTL